MKTRKILAASTAALLSMASIAAVASAEDSEGAAAATPVDIEFDTDGDFTDAGDVQYRIAEKDKDKFADLTILGTATNVTSSTDATAVRGFVGDDMKDKLVNAIVEKLVDGDGNVTGAMVDIAVGKASTDGSVSRKEINLKAPIEINIDGFDFEANHVYHVDGAKLVEIKTEDLTEEIDNEASPAVHTYGVIFKSKTFSPFIITKDVVKGAVALDSDDNPANDDESGESGESGANAGDNANTGIALAIAPVVLAAGAVAVVALKKKH